MADAALTVGANKEQIAVVVAAATAVLTRKWSNKSKGDLHDHLSFNMNLRDRIKNSKDTRHASKMWCRREYDQEHGAPEHGHALPGGLPQASDLSPTGSVPSSGQKTSSSMTWTLMTERLTPSSG
jgi:hypothetical protein